MNTSKLMRKTAGRKKIANEFIVNMMKEPLVGENIPSEVNVYTCLLESCQDKNQRPVTNIQIILSVTRLVNERIPEWQIEYRWSETALGSGRGTKRGFPVEIPKTTGLSTKEKYQYRTPSITHSVVVQHRERNLERSQRLPGLGIVVEDRLLTCACDKAWATRLPRSKTHPVLFDGYRHVSSFPRSRGIINQGIKGYWDSQMCGHPEYDESESGPYRLLVTLCQRC